MNFNLKGGGWIVEALQTIASNLHLRIMAYGTVAALIIWVIRWW